MANDNDVTSRPKLLRVPSRLKSRAMFIGTLANLPTVDEGTEFIVIALDEGGCWLMMEDGITAERINWMLDRAKHSLHDGDRDE